MSETVYTMDADTAGEWFDDNFYNWRFDHDMLREVACRSERTVDELEDLWQGVKREWVVRMLTGGKQR